MEDSKASGDKYPDTVSGDDPAFDTRVSHHARGYNYLLGGKDHFEADRAYVDEVAAVYPGVVATARANRAFLGRAVRFMAGEAGLSQFLDIGTGIPAPGSTHEVAQDVRPDARIVYVDNDPVVLSHARAYLVGHEQGTTDYIDADLRNPELILERAAETLDFSKPVGLLLLAILHAIPDADNPQRIASTLLNALPAGSYVAITHWAADEASREKETKFMDVTQQMSHQQYTPRSHTEITRLFGGLELVEPGLVPMDSWRSDAQDPLAGNLIPWLGGVGRKTAR
jgi:hypothetical protein